MSITLGTPLAEALSSAIQEKLVEIGWSAPGEDSSPLSEYICLMLVNGKSQEQIAEELSGDLLGLPKEDDSATVFSAWLFGKVAELNGGGSGDRGRAGADGQAQQTLRENGAREGMREQEQSEIAGAEAGAGTGADGSMEYEMGEMTSVPPTGPKAMRAGPRKDRLFNQINKAMDRSQTDTLRRVRQQPGERIEKREPPKGPRGVLSGPRTGPSPPGQIGGRLGGQMGRQNGHMNRGLPPFPNGLPSGIPPHLSAQFATMNPQQQMAFYQMIEQQNQILGLMQGFSGSPGMMMPPMPTMPTMPTMPSMPTMPGPNGFRVPPHQFNQFSQHQQQQQQQQQRPQRSLFDLIESPPQIANPPSQSQRNGSTEPQPEASKEVEMETEEPFFEDKVGQQPEEEDSFKIACKFGNNCTKPECPFAHPTPVVPGKLNISFMEKCPFGVNCKNRKCIGAHPSPASAPQPKPRPATIQADCKFFPNCKNPVCPFRHPEPAMPYCRNGPNCTRPDCHFTHAEAPPCKYNPCLNPNCIYTHTEGQQQGAFDNKVWTAGKKEHVSERRFVTSEGEGEELIIPGQPPKKVGGVRSGEEEEGQPPGSAGSTDSSHTMHADMETVREDDDLVVA
ncbi:hypothetical protein BDZ91DRAFT_800976 [Kalaharituber pfeilii]|nr:hypothetical protein BDZ91DRAFT_800976 [Kalaharituber pfeilii]